MYGNLACAMAPLYRVVCFGMGRTSKAQPASLHLRMSRWEWPMYAARATPPFPLGPQPNLSSPGRGAQRVGVSNVSGPAGPQDKSLAIIPRALSSGEDYPRQNAAMQCHAMPRNAALRHATLCYAMFCQARMRACHAMLCYAMPCYAVMCGVALCYVVHCSAMHVALRCAM